MLSDDFAISKELSVIEQVTTTLKRAVVDMSDIALRVALDAKDITRYQVRNVVAAKQVKSGGRLSHDKLEQQLGDLNLDDIINE